MFKGLLTAGRSQAARSLQRMSLPKDLIAKLKARHICSAGELLSKSKLDLLELLEDVCLSDIEQLIKAVSVKVAVANTTVHRSQSKCKSYFCSLDLKQNLQIL